MRSKSELQTILKEKYAVNKNISQPLSVQECEQLLVLLGNHPGAAKLVDSFVSKNSDLSQNNRYYGQLRSQAEKKMKTLQVEHAQLQQTIRNLESSNGSLGHRKQALSTEHRALEQQVNELASKNRALSLKVQTLTSENSQLSDANTQLQKDNKDLKNVVDQIRLRLARDTKTLLQYEDSEIRKALIRLFQWTLG